MATVIKATEKWPLKNSYRKNGYGKYWATD